MRLQPLLFDHGETCNNVGAIKVRVFVKIVTVYTSMPGNS